MSPVLTEELPYVLVCAHVYLSVLVTVADFLELLIVVPSDVAVSAPVDALTAVNPLVVVFAIVYVALVVSVP